MGIQRRPCLLRAYNCLLDCSENPGLHESALRLGRR